MRIVDRGRAKSIPHVPGPSCPNCRRRTTRRCRRTGVVERIASLVYVYPFRCEVCGRRFYTVRWRTRYARVQRDRRVHERVEVTAPIVIDLAGYRVDGVVRNISLGGCGVLTQAVLNVGDAVTLEIGGDPAGPILADAVAMSIRPGIVGFTFVRLLAGHAGRLAALLGRARHARNDRARARPMTVSVAQRARIS